MAEYLIQGLAVGNPGAGVKNLVHAIMRKGINEFIHVSGKLDTAVDCRLAKNLLECTTQWEAKASLLQGGQTEFDHVRSWRISGGIPKVGIAKIDRAKRQEREGIARRIQSLRMAEEFKTTSSMVYDHAFQLVHVFLHEKAAMEKWIEVLS